MKKISVAPTTSCEENVRLELISSGKESYDSLNVSCASDCELPNLMTSTLAQSSGNSVDPTPPRFILVASRNDSRDSFEMEEVRREPQQTSSGSPDMATQSPNYQGSFHEPETTDITIWKINISEVETGNCAIEDGNWEANIGNLEESKEESNNWEMSETNEISLESDNGKNWSSNVDNFIEGVEVRDHAWNTNLPSIHIPPTRDGWLSDVTSIEVPTNDQWKHDINALSESKKEQNWEFKLHQNLPDLDLSNKWNSDLKEINVGKYKDWKSNLSDVLHKSEKKWRMQIGLLKEKNYLKNYSKSWRGAIDNLSFKNEKKWKSSVDKGYVGDPYQGKWKENIDISPYKGIDNGKWNSDISDLNINDVDSEKQWSSDLSEIDTTRRDDDVKKWTYNVGDDVKLTGETLSNWSSDLNDELACQENETNWKSNIRDVNNDNVDTAGHWEGNIKHFKEGDDHPRIASNIRHVQVVKEDAWPVDIPPLEYSEGSSCVIV